MAPAQSVCVPAGPNGLYEWGHVGLFPAWNPNPTDSARVKRFAANERSESARVHPPIKTKVLMTERQLPVAGHPNN